MFDSIKAWARRHKKSITIICVIVSVVGAVAVLVINGRKVTIPVKELADKVVPDIPRAVKPIEASMGTFNEVAPQIDETVTVDVDGLLKTFPRAEFIRHLHEGWHASAEKLAQATAMGINLKPGETLVDACMVKRHAA